MQNALTCEARIDYSNQLLMLVFCRSFVALFVPGTSRRPIQPAKHLVARGADEGSRDGNVTRPMEISGTAGVWASDRTHSLSAV